jgi:hypothetical protein
MSIKHCTRCQTTKPRSEFGRDRSRRDGLYPWCKPCKRTNAKICRERSPEEARTRTERYQAKRDANIEARTRYLQRAAAYTLQKRYGITTADYNVIWDGQGGICAICGRPPKAGRWGSLQVDHDHDTGEIRGLLCFSCNAGLGQLGDSPESLERALCYVASHTPIGTVTA